MMDLSFRWPHPRFMTSIGEISVRLHTHDNQFGVDPDTLTTDMFNTRTVARSPRLRWAGGQRVTPGSLTASIADSGSGIEVEITGEHQAGIRSLVLTLHDVPTSALTGMREQPLEIPAAGRTVRYPDGWFDLATPLLALSGAGTDLVIRSSELAPRPRMFVFIPHVDDLSLMEVELIVEADATQGNRLVTSGTWHIDRTSDISTIRNVHRKHVHDGYGVAAWEERHDVPDWMHQVSLVANLHGQHFTGRTFLDYQAMADTVERLSEWIDPRRILAYLPGWEGRYYRFYGRYAPEATMGGEDGFAKMIQKIHSLGAHVMPMFGANIASRDIEGWERWGEPGRQLMPSGLAPIGSVDWDASRHFDHGFGAVINTSYAPWRAHLVGQIVDLQRTYGFDATFLDISAMFANDPHGRTIDGNRQLVSEIHEQIPDHLIAGEGWYDAISGDVPLVQVGHRNNVPNFHDVPDEDLFVRSNRSFGHVNQGDPAHGSSGVHEAGYVATWRLPVRRGVIPTVGVVDDTLLLAEARVRMIIADAQDYADQFLGNR